MRTLAQSRAAAFFPVVVFIGNLPSSLEMLSAGVNPPNFSPPTFQLAPPLPVLFQPPLPPTMDTPPYAAYSNARKSVPNKPRKKSQKAMASSVEDKNVRESFNGGGGGGGGESSEMELMNSDSGRAPPPTELIHRQKTSATSGMSRTTVKTEGEGSRTPPVTIEGEGIHQVFMIPPEMDVQMCRGNADSSLCKPANPDNGQLGHRKFAQSTVHASSFAGGSGGAGATVGAPAPAPAEAPAGDGEWWGCCARCCYLDEYDCCTRYSLACFRPIQLTKTISNCVLFARNPGKHGKTFEFPPMECPAIPPPKSDKNATSKGYTCKVNDGKLHKGKRYCFRPAGENFSGYGRWDMRCAVDGVNGTKNSQGVDDGRVTVARIRYIAGQDGTFTYGPHVMDDFKVSKKN